LLGAAATDRYTRWAAELTCATAEGRFFFVLDVEQVGE